MKKKKQKKPFYKRWWFWLIAVLLFFGVVGSSGDDTTTTDLDTTITEAIETTEQSLSEEAYDVLTTEDDITEKETSETTSEGTTQKAPTSVGTGSASPANLSNIPAFSGKAYTYINGNQPNFSSSELTTKGYEKYSNLDSLGRCGVAIASCGKEIMPASGEERGSISSVKPSGWNQAKYDGVSGGWLWNRCHLIGWQLSAENANRQNLITGTRYMNINGMLVFENMVADYIKETNNHVAYRVTPIYKGNNLVCSGVQIEAYSIEDDGDGICFNVYCYNVQPGIVIDYSDGSSYASGSSSNTEENATEKKEPPTSSAASSGGSYVLNTNSMKFHYPTCSSAKQISAANRAESNKSREQLINEGYDPCGRCHP